MKLTLNLIPHLDQSQMPSPTQQAIYLFKQGKDNTHLIIYTKLYMYTPLIFIGKMKFQRTGYVTKIKV